MISKRFVSVLLFVAPSGVGALWAASQKELDAIAFNRDPAVRKNFRRFVQKHRPPVELQVLIEENKDEIVQMGFGVHRNIPAFYVKGTNLRAPDVHRVINVDRMGAVMQQHNLYLLDIPKKYLYKIYGKWYVFAERVIGKAIRYKTSLELMQQRAKLVEETGFRDWAAGDNVILNDQDREVCIDTEDRSFGNNWYCHPKVPNAFMRSRLNCIPRHPDNTDPEAIEWLENRIAVLASSPEGEKKETIVHNKRFDDPTIDIESVKKYLSNLREYSLLDEDDGYMSEEKQQKTIDRRPAVFHRHELEKLSQQIEKAPNDVEARESANRMQQLVNRASIEFKLKQALAEGNQLATF